MLNYPKISPDLISLGPLKVRWYGLMYILAYTWGYIFMKKRAAQGLVRMNYRAVEMWITYMVVGMLVGARLAYVFLYNWSYYSEHLLELFYIWEGGLSFHGAIAGMSAGCYLFGRRFGLSFFEIADGMAYCGTPGLFFGRIGNFINGELYGRPSDVGWAMIFPRDPLQVPRHPSQLYEAFAEGFAIALILYALHRILLRKRIYRSGVICSVFLILYGVARFFIEFTREPDSQLGFVWGSLSMGQILCLLMVGIGVGLLMYALKTQKIWQPVPPSKSYLEQEKAAGLLTS